MRIEELPDGTLVTTPVYVGVGHPNALCKEHVWEAGVSSPVPADAPEKARGLNTMVIETCKACGWQRVHLVR